MEKLYRVEDLVIDSLNEGDIIEIYSGVFVKIKQIKQIITEDLAGIKKTSLKIKSEIIANGRTTRRP